MRILLLAALVFAQDTAVKPKPSGDPVPADLDFQDAPLPKSDPGSAVGVTPGELDFLFPGKIIQQNGPMIAKGELRDHKLKTRDDGFIKEGGGKRGFKKVSFAENRVVAANPVPAAAAGSAPLVYGVVMAQASANTHAALAQMIATLPPGSLASIMTGHILAGGSVPQNGNLKRNQIWVTGTKLQDKAGYTAEMVQFDGSKMMGQRHKWKITDKEGAVHYEYSSPLILDLDGDGVRMSRRSGRFDADGDGKLDAVSEVSAGDGLLVLDTDHDGAYGEGGMEAFGDATDLDGDHKRDGYLDGFEALLALAKKTGADSDDLLDAKELAKLEKSHGLRIKVGGVLKPAVPLSEAGVVSIALPRTKSETVKDFDGQGNKTTRREGAYFTKKDGSTANYEDVWFEM